MALRKKKAKIVAEAKTLRAFYNLLLVTYYGPVTLTTEEVGNVNTKPVRNTVEDFYQSITTDLKEAAEALDNTPVDGNYARVTKKTALGILARVPTHKALAKVSKRTASHTGSVHAKWPRILSPIPLPTTSISMTISTTSGRRKTTETTKRLSLSHQEPTPRSQT